MKNTFIIIVTILLSLVSCTQNELTEFDPYNGPTLATFTESNIILPVEDGGTEEIEIEIGVSSLSETERIIVVGVDLEQTTANPLNYSFNTEVIIPANEHYTNLILTVHDEALESAEFLFLKLVSVEDGQVDSGTYQVVMFQN